VKRWIPLLLCVAIAGCGRPDTTPLPTRETHIDPVLKKLEQADEQARKRREEMDAAAK
jgi:hypothetical protein